VIDQSGLVERRKRGRLSSRPVGSSQPITCGWLDSVLFIALMSGPPKFRQRDALASLTGQIDAMVAMQIAVWVCGGLWVFLRLYPSVLRRGRVPPVRALQVLSTLLVATLSLSILDSPGVLLTGFMLGQFVVMIAFSWVFLHRFGITTYLRHLFACIVLLLVTIAASIFVAPELVMAGANSFRVRGDTIGPTGALAAMALVFCLSNVPRLKAGLFWLAVVFFGIMLAAAQTRTAFIAFMLYLAIGFVYGKNLRVRRLVPLLASIAVLLVFLDVASQATGFMVRETQSVESMSDRLPLWGYLTRAVMDRAPLTGLGYYAASRVVATEYNRNLGTAHSVIFEVLVGGGFVATAVYLLLCAALVWGSRELLRSSTRRPESVAIAGLLGVALCQSLTATDGLNAGPVGFTFWSLTALIPAMARETIPLREFGALRLPLSRTALRRPRFARAPQ
jgi:O-antigen ligase